MSGATHPARRMFGVVVRPLQAFLQLEAASGILLFGAALAALVWSNLDPRSYDVLFGQPYTVAAGDLVARFSLRALVNDGLMTIFFFVVGLEVKRELVCGELSTFGRASLPAVAALGGMLLPAAIFLAVNAGHPSQRGWGIPIATDIAFSIGILRLLGRRVPRALVVLVTALAIFDDIGAILVIAIFYGQGVSAAWLAVAGASCAVLLVMNRAHVASGLGYALVGAVVWYALHESGIHPTLAGVIVGLAVPARARRPSRAVLGELGEFIRDLERKPADEELENAEVQMIEEKLEHIQSPAERLIRLVHPTVAFAIMPLFALANSGFVLHGMAAPSRVALGVGAGLLFGKQLGVFAFTWAAVRLGLAPMPRHSSLTQLWGVSIVTGIGFTVALFIAALAFGDDARLLNDAKLGILLGSIASGLVGYVVLRAAPSRAEAGSRRRDEDARAEARQRDRGR